MPISQERFVIRRRSEDVTMNGLFGARPDENRVFVPGPREYYVDGVLVTEDVFRAEFEKAYPGCQLFEER